ncbi:MAG: hypothetical protein J6P91_03970, partial [Methanobrevibacter sp.]|nr:hypothetical protein [Methanobrevibacter sp.]
SDYYSINGVVDVLSSKMVDKFYQKTNNNPFQQTLDDYFNLSQTNSIINYLYNNDEFKKLLDDELNEYEIIIDYKGMRRPSAPTKDELMEIQSFMENGTLFDSEEYEKYKVWIQHEWQILTYAWLRKNQENSDKPIVGIIFYLNELVPSNDDLKAIKEDLLKDQTDITLNQILDEDWERLRNWNEDSEIAIHRDLSDKFKMDRSIRIINVEEELIDNSLYQFDNVVNNIESSLIKEMNGCKIKDAWKAEAEDRTCSACDFRTFCNKKKGEESNHNQVFTIP